jgi:SAM-dependent methyltransferase
MFCFVEKLRAHAEEKFGVNNEEALKAWLEYWASTVERNQSIISFFRSKLELSFRGKKVLDLGCGTAGLSQLVTEEGGTYYGLEYFEKTLELGASFIKALSGKRQAFLVRASGVKLPFQASCFDYVIAFDVIEHLVGGDAWQVQFLKEIERVMKGEGILLLTTPNRLCPLEGHTFMVGPQFLPAAWADRYVRWIRPRFFCDYKSYGEIHLLSPWRMKSILLESDLVPLHELPWCMDLKFYRPGARILLTFCRLLKLDWAVFYKFQIAVVKKASASRLQSLKYTLGQQKFFQEQGLGKLLRKGLVLIKR